jgi:hypothetical protein
MSAFASDQTADANVTANEQWLRDKFSDQHARLMPVVAVADMFFACNKDKKTDPIPYRVNQLIIKMDRTLLSEKLVTCLGNKNIKSNEAIDYGLTGCFHEQLSSLTNEEKVTKMALVMQAMKRLSLEEKQASFTRCVTEQAIQYLQ